MTIMLEIITDNNLIEKNINLTSKDKMVIKRILKTIKKGVLYNSKLHGYYHSKRVLFFSYIIAKHEKLDKKDFQIIIDAALYHDIGRVNDKEDSLHGLRGALEIEKVVDHPLYKDKENLNLLKAIIEGHSVDDKKKNSFIKKYNLTQINRYYKLYNILKDADALDRKRLFDDLDEDFLRLNISRTLIKLAGKVNNIYKERLV